MLGRVVNLGDEMKKSLLITVIIALAFMTTAAMADSIIDVRYNTHVYENTGCSPAVSSCIFDVLANRTYETWTDAATGDTVTLNYYGVGNPGLFGATASYNDAFIGNAGVSGAQFGQFNITSTGNHGALGLSSAI